MKVLFAVSNEEISESIVKRYQREYKEIISYKNVYYFNAIVKELQKDKTYDRVVISEELEAFSNTQYSQIDKFIFDKLDSISDEASNLKGEDIPIILICSDRREKAEDMLVKLFGIGIYDALLGNDRSVENVCNLLNKPRLKKDAKAYYKIDSEDVTYQSEDENYVSEVEIQNILAHYKRLGKDERKYVESFENIASQYSDTQLRIISKFLPLNVRAVLEEKSSKYQQVISFNSKVSDTLRVQDTKKEEKDGRSEKFLGSRDKTITEPVVIPSSLNMNSNRKLSKPKVTEKAVTDVRKIGPMFEEKHEKEVEVKPLNLDDFDDIDEIEEVEETPKVQEVHEVQKIQEFEPEEKTVDAPRRGRPRKYPVPDESEMEDKPKRGRGRPRKYPVPDESELENKPKRGRGRPKKYTEIDDIEEEPQKIFEPELDEDELDEDDMTILPGFGSEPDEDKEETILPGFDDELEENEDDSEEDIEEENDKDDIETLLPGFEIEDEEDEEDEKYEVKNEVKEKHEEETILPGFNETDRYEPKLPSVREADRHHENVDISNLLTSSKKVACFVGTSKNGTSFIVNNLAQITAQMGIDTAILDTTKNRNSYYIYTKNEENLRKRAMESINSLLQGSARGIEVEKNLTVYTALPEETDGIENAGLILQTLLKRHSLVLIDCDFNTPVEYFEKTQEIYLVQSFDILTIQPLTAFLRDLKSKNVLEPSKLRVVLNKDLKLRGVNEKVIIGGIAYYNDPAMSFMTELFDKNTIKYISIPFNEETYIKYLENIINCQVSVKGYPKMIVQLLNELANMVYPLISGRVAYNPPAMDRNGFTPSMNSTLDQMRNKY